MTTLEQRLARNEIIILDGATGTELERRDSGRELGERLVKEGLHSP
jgi:S-methylmethionine-dependent homocysteine/selenocysteine methylase